MIFRGRATGRSLFHAPLPCRNGSSLVYHMAQMHIETWLTAMAVPCNWCVHFVIPSSAEPIDCPPYILVMRWCRNKCSYSSGTLQQPVTIPQPMALPEDTRTVCHVRNIRIFDQDSKVTYLQPVACLIQCFVIWQVALLTSRVMKFCSPSQIDRSTQCGSGRV